MKGKVFVTAGTHDVGFTWREKQFERQGVWETSLRDSQEVHLAGGMPRLRTVSVARPVQRQGRQRHAEPRARVRLPAGDGGRGARVRAADPHDAGAARVPPAGDRGGRGRAAVVL